MRLAAGFSLPVLLLTHVIGSRAAYSLHGAAPTYERIVESLIVSACEIQRAYVQASLVDRAARVPARFPSFVCRACGRRRAPDPACR